MGDPVYRQIAEDLRHQIDAGQLAPGQQIRTELELREKYEASRNTVRDAIKWLITRGLVETRPGQGTFVVETITPFVTTLTGSPDTAAPYSQEVTAKLRRPKDTPPRVEIQEAGSQVAPELQLSEGASVVSRHQERFIDDTPWSLQTSFYAMRVVERGAIRLLQAGDISEGTVKYLGDVLGIKQAGYHDMIIVRAPHEVEARFFRLPDDGRVSVIELRRTAFDDQGAPVRLTVSVYPADRNQFALNVGQLPDEVADPSAESSGGLYSAESAEPSKAEP